MSDDTTPAPATKAGGNQNATVGLVLGAILLLLFLILLTMNGGILERSGTSEIEELRRSIENKRNEIDAERGRLGLPPLGGASSGLTATALAARISDDSGKLSSIVRQMQGLLTEKDTRLNTAEATRKALTQQITELQSQVDQGKLALADAEALRRELADTKTLLSAANSTVESLRQQLASGPNEAAMANLQQSLDNALRDADAMRAQLAEVDSLRAQLDQLIPENNELRYKLQQLQAQLDRTRLFVDKADQLPPAAKALYVELSQLETATPAQLKQEYTRIDQELQARIIDTISFPTGSSRVNLDKAEEIKRRVEAGGEDSFFLVVGYASKTGTLETNKKLSSERATTIASVADFHKRGSQGVSAVFFGQTDRFASDPLRNQLCEVWEVYK